MTPCAGYVPTWAACLISITAGAVCYVAVQFRARRGWDDSLDVWGVHGVGGVLGSLLVGAFSFASVDGVNGLLAANARQFGLQCAGVAIVMAYTFTVMFGIFKVLDLRQTLNVPSHVQLKGLDAELHGETAYDLS